MARYYLTTAIDYVNSRPHIGTAYEKIAADVIARYRRLCGFDVHFVMGNDEHSQNVFRKARELGLDPLGLLRPHGAGVPRGLVAPEHLVRRLHPHHRAAASDARWRRSCARPTRPGTSTRGCTRAGTASPARPSSRRRTSSTVCVRSTRRSQTGSRNELLLPALGLSRPAARALPGPPVIRRARVAAQRSAAFDRGGPRGHLGQPGRPGVGHSAAVRPVERRLRLVRRAHQLRRGCRLRDGRRAVRHLVAGGSASRRQGHHAVPLRRLAGDAR